MNPGGEPRRPELTAEEYHAAYHTVVSSRVRLARNVRGFPFPETASKSARMDVLQQVIAAAREELPVHIPVGRETGVARQALFESHLISRTFLEPRGETAVLMDEARERVVMVNEEDHLRIQVLRGGLALTKAWEMADALDDVLESKLNYSFSTGLGFLTSCPTNVGTGMRASALMHLPGLVLMDELDPIVRGLNKIGMTVRGSWGEGSAALGHMFQVSNQRTLGLTEGQIVQELEQIVQELAEHEQNARLRLARNRKHFVQDLVGRSEAILRSAVLMTTREAIERLSDLRLGIVLGVAKRSSLQAVDRLLLEVQPAHLQQMQGKALSAQQRDYRRARHLRAGLRRRIAVKRKTDE